eukprot:scaffold5646_cov27-Prasinocladus_malaysianus.AAC.1
MSQQHPNCPHCYGTGKLEGQQGVIREALSVDGVSSTLVATQDHQRGQIATQDHKVTSLAVLRGPVDGSWGVDPHEFLALVTVAVQTDPVELWMRNHDAVQVLRHAHHNAFIRRHSSTPSQILCFCEELKPWSHSCEASLQHMIHT